MEEENKTTNAAEKEGKGLSITSMVLGIVALVLFNSVLISIPCAILAIIFGVIGNKKNKNGYAKAGLILGIIATIISITLLAISIYITTSVDDGLFEAAKEAAEKTKRTESQLESGTIKNNGKTYSLLEDYMSDY